MYIKAFNREHPADIVTGNKWIADVDDLFLCHHVNGDHWVALRIELHMGKIHVYDMENSSLIFGTRRSPKMRTREIAVCTLDVH
ncbi:unnamed protein product [Brassica rapa subsp. trilocularis]